MSNFPASLWNCSDESVIITAAHWRELTLQHTVDNEPPVVIRFDFHLLSIPLKRHPDEGRVFVFFYLIYESNLHVIHAKSTGSSDARKIAKSR